MILPSLKVKDLPEFAKPLIFTKGESSMDLLAENGDMLLSWDSSAEDEQLAPLSIVSAIEYIKSAIKFAGYNNFKKQLVEAKKEILFPLSQNCGHTKPTTKHANFLLRECGGGYFFYAAEYKPPETNL